MTNSSKPIRGGTTSVRALTAHGVIERITKGLTQLLLAIGSFALIVLLLLIFADVVMRNLFNQPIPGVTEIASFWLMVPIVFIGIWWAEIMRDNISVTLLTERLGKKTSVLTSTLVSVVLVAFLLLLAHLSFQEGLVRAAQGEYAGVYRIPIWPMRMVVAFGLAAYAVVVLTRAVGLLFSKDQPAVQPKLGRKSRDA